MNVLLALARRDRSNDVQSVGVTAELRSKNWAQLLCPSRVYFLPSSFSQRVNNMSGLTQTTEEQKNYFFEFEHEKRCGQPKVLVCFAQFSCTRGTLSQALPKWENSRQSLEGA